MPVEGLAEIAAGRTEPDRLAEVNALYSLTDRVYRATSIADIYEAGLDAITAALGCERASILLFDDDAVMRFVAWRGLSERYRTRLEGHTPWSSDDTDPAPIFVEDIRQSSEPDWIKDEITAEGIVALGFIPLLASGRVVGKFMIYYGRRHSVTQHMMQLAVTIARQIGFSVERARIEASRQKTMEELRQSEERFRLMSENAPVMIWMSDQAGACLHLNRLLREFWGLGEDQIASFDWRSTMHPEDTERIVAAITEAMTNRTSLEVVGRYRNARGGWAILQTSAQPRVSSEGAFMGMIGVNVDVTERERTARQRELMLDELNHRVKNTLAVVQAIAYQSFRKDRDRPSVASFSQRIATLASAHNLLTRQNWESTPLDQLVAAALASGRSDHARFAIDGPAIEVSPKVALSIALALHELRTNALKYGALSVDTGRVSLRWDCAGAGRLCLTWAETGGPAVTPPASRGFGTHMIENILANDLGGTISLDFDPAGVVCRIDAPLDKGAEAS